MDVHNFSLRRFKSEAMQSRENMNQLREIIKLQYVVIQNLKQDLMSTRGTLHCRGLLESLLKEVHIEKNLSGNFNAIHTC